MYQERREIYVYLSTHSLTCMQSEVFLLLEQKEGISDSLWLSFSFVLLTIERLCLKNSKIASLSRISIIISMDNPQTLLSSHFVCEGYLKQFN